MQQKKGAFFGATAIIVALAVLAAAVSISANYNETLRFNSFQSTLLQVDEVTPKLDGWFKIQFSAVNRDLAFLNSKANLSKTEVTEYFAQVLRRSGGDYVDIYVGWPDGSATFGGGWVPGRDWDSRQLAWYLEAAAKPGSINVSAPFVDPNSGKLCVRLASTIAAFNADRGVFAAELPLDPLTAYLNQANKIKDARTFLVNGAGEVLLHPNQAYLPTPEGVFSNVTTIDGGRFAAYWQSIVTENNLSIVENENIEGDVVHFTASRLQSTDWYLISEITPSTGFAGANYQSMLIIQGIILLAVFLCLILINLLASRSAAGPPKEITEAAEKLSLGALELTLDPDRYSGETRYLAESLSYIAVNAKAQAAVLESAAKGNYSANAELRSDEDQLNQALNQMLANVGATFAQIREEALWLAARAEKTMAEGRLPEADAGRNLALVEQIAALLGEIAQKAAQSAEDTGNARQIAGSIGENTQKGGAQIKAIAALLAEISQANQRMDSSLEQIGALATQTNLTALNAAMEAALAGAYGQRFAELADQMNELALNIAATANETKTLAASATEKATLGTLQAEETLPLLAAIEAGLSEENSLTDAVAAHTAALLEHLQQVADSAGEATQLAGQNHAIAQANAVALEEMNQQALHLAELTNKTP